MLKYDSIRSVEKELAKLKSSFVESLDDHYKEVYFPRSWKGDQKWSKQSIPKFIYEYREKDSILNSHLNYPNYFYRGMTVYSQELLHTYLQLCVNKATNTKEKYINEAWENWEAYEDGKSNEPLDVKYYIENFKQLCNNLWERYEEFYAVGGSRDILTDEFRTALRSPTNMERSLAMLSAADFEEFAE